MSSSRSFSLLLLILVAALAACGFQSAVVDRSGTTPAFGSTSVKVAGDQAGYEFERVLQRKFGVAGASAPYHLEATIEISGGKGAIQGSGGHYRYELAGTVSFTLADAEGNLLLERRLIESVNWGSGREVLANLAARQDAEQRLYRELANRMFTAVIAAQAGNRQEAPPQYGTVQG